MKVAKFIIVTGNPVDGLSFFGPFDTPQGAGDWADEKLRKDEWWIAIVEAVQEDD